MIVGILGDMIMKVMVCKDCSKITNYTNFSTKHIKEFQEKGTSTYLPYRAGIQKLFSRFILLIYRRTMVQSLFDWNPGGSACIECEEQMRIIAFITNSRLVAKILEHFRKQTPRAPPMIPIGPVPSFSDFDDTNFRQA